MTNIEALQSELPGMVISDNTLQKALYDAGLVFNSDYLVSNRELIGSCAVSVLEKMLSAADISEGDMSVRYNKDAIAARIGAIKESIGTTVQPKVRGVRPW